LPDNVDKIRLQYPNAEAILSYPSIPSPIWFSSAYDHSNLTAVVDENGLIVKYRDVLVVEAGVTPPPGTEVYLTKVPGGLIVAEEKETRAKRLQDAVDAYQAQLQKEKLEAQSRQIARQENAAQANAKLRIPVRWSSGQKRVLSGLTRNSYGTGENARTVNHALLLEPIAEGNFRRAAGDFLCTAASGSNGRDWTRHRHSVDHGVSGTYVSQITCKQCLKTANRWSQSPEWKLAELVDDEFNDDCVAF
jgi:hypothetical protein